MTLEEYRAQMKMIFGDEAPEICAYLEAKSWFPATLEDDIDSPDRKAKHDNKSASNS